MKPFKAYYITSRFPFWAVWLYNDDFKVVQKKYFLRYQTAQDFAHASAEHSIDYWYVIHGIIV